MPMSNRLISQTLLQVARSLGRERNLYRQRAYRQAALMIQGLDEPVSEIIKTKGRFALAVIPGIGDHIAYTIDMLLKTGKVIMWSERSQAAVA